jgi:hypothetical protein
LRVSKSILTKASNSLITISIRTYSCWHHTNSLAFEQSVWVWILFWVENSMLSKIVWFFHTILIAHENDVAICSGFKFKWYTLPSGFNINSDDCIICFMFCQVPNDFYFKI